jgi:hypothetical protein
MNPLNKEPRGHRKQAIILAAAFACVCAALAAYFVTRTGSPKAPALRAEPVYQNSREGFRFVAPEGWVQVAKSEPPRGEAKTERLLVRYETAGGVGPATMVVAFIDFPESTDLAKYLSVPSYGVSDWQLVGVAEPITIQSVSATRWTFRSRQYSKEVVVFQRQQRFYFFTIIAPPAGNAARDLAMKSIDGVVWMK